MIFDYCEIRTWRAGLGAAALAVMLASPIAARAEEPGIWEREKLTGDWGGARKALEDKGIKFEIEYIGEVFSVLSGGIQRGTTYEGRLGLTVETDLEKIFGWTGAKIEGKIFQIHNSGHNVADYAGSISDPSNIDALPTTRLFTLWFQQDFGKAGSFRFGQLAADDEFLTSDTAGGLINGTFGWANIMAANLPAGGPAYPLATPGMRLELNPTDNVKVLGAVFSGNPAGANCKLENPQECNKYGTTFSFSGGAFLIGEVQYLLNQDEKSTGLKSAYKLGAWYHTGSFADQRLGSDPSGRIIPLALAPDYDLNHRGDWGVYGVIDQMVWRGTNSSVSVFARGGAVPSDRNFLSWYVDGGIGVKGLFQGRADDTLTFGVAYSKVSNDAAAVDRDINYYFGTPYPIRSGETVLELSYIAQVAKWWTIQPDLQYIIRPGGNVPDPDDPTQTIGNAFIIGLRSTINF